MNVELRETVAKFANATLQRLEADGLKVTREMFARKTRFSGRKNPQLSATSDLRRRLLDRSLWKRSEEQMCNDWMLDLFKELVAAREAAASKVELSAARQRQLELFPGFETLPTRIRTGKSYLRFPELPVAQFLDYEKKYQARAVRDQRKADELRRLAEKVRPYAEMEFTMAAAFERSQFESPTLVVVSKSS
jgi:hypothetical protein